MAHRPGRRLGTAAAAVLLLGAALIGGPTAFTLSRFDAVRAGSDNMRPTLVPGDLVVLRKKATPVGRGDLVRFDPAEWGVPGPFLGRVVAVGGDRISYREGAATLTLNGRPLQEPYVLGGAPGAGGTDFDVTVPPGRLFLLGDNRDDSADSRFHPQHEHGTLPVSAVTGVGFSHEHPVAVGLVLSVAAGLCTLPVGAGLAVAWLVARRRGRRAPVRPAWDSSRGA
ncbi:signal peptidase I [Streptomyces sp. cmx-4-9]|uniref:signal peptidase I n=1 Tax=Streptomyces sp. cmx-4-9 TaxID=2790941 RepID=UPI003980BDAC